MEIDTIATQTVFLENLSVKEFENRLIFADVMTKNKVAVFLEHCVEASRRVVLKERFVILSDKETDEEKSDDSSRTSRTSHGGTEIRSLR